MNFQIKLWLGKDSWIQTATFDPNQWDCPENMQGTWGLRNAYRACVRPKLLLWFQCLICLQVSHSSCRSKPMTMFLIVPGRQRFFLSLIFELFRMKWSKKQALSCGSHWPPENLTAMTSTTATPQTSASEICWQNESSKKKKLLLPTHPVPTSIDKVCWALHSAFPGNTAEDSTTPSVPPFLKPPHTPHGPEVLLLLTGWHTRTFSAMLSIWWLPQSRTAVSEETKKYFEYWETSQEVNAISALLCHGHCGDCCRCFLHVMLLLFWISSFLWSRELCYTTSLDILFKTFAYSDHYIQTTADFTTWSTSTDPSIPPTTEIPYSMAVSLLSTCHSPSQLWLHFPHCKSYSHILWGLKLFKCWEYFSKKR